RFGYCAPLKPVPAVQRVAALRTFEKPPGWAVFFVSRARDYDAPTRISRRSSVIFNRYLSLDS
ncbi:hypothetical protein OV073_26015, partial [Salmonella enterica subsp. enterica serovar 1,4,[5],12:i:-]|nr:hypothetical protein [Salmonella enterica subsp. enterica serovar 1,4,[5],12:i:-]